jgi:hypothetical protein
MKLKQSDLKLKDIVRSNIGVSDSESDIFAKEQRTSYRFNAKKMVINSNILLLFQVRKMLT